MTITSEFLHSPKTCDEVDPCDGVTAAILADRRDSDYTVIERREFLTDAIFTRGQVISDLRAQIVSVEHQVTMLVAQRARLEQQTNMPGENKG